jgi:hypothetical protein
MGRWDDIGVAEKRSQMCRAQVIQISEDLLSDPVL